MVKILGYMQKLGQALLLPIAVLPIAALMLRLGLPDVLDLPVMANAGEQLIDHLPLLFAAGTAAGLSRDHSAAAALASLVGYLVLTESLHTLQPELTLGNVGGILAGMLAGHTYNQFSDVRLPPLLGFFAGKRCVPIITGLLAFVLAGICSLLWPPFQQAILWIGQWIMAGHEGSPFVYGLANRLLVPLNLHHILNNMVWNELGEFNGVTGEAARFLAGDTSAGLMLSGLYPPLMMGLPGAALAMYTQAKQKNRTVAGGVLLIVGFTAFLTGTTEPIEFMFLFLAPILYLLHAILTGLSMFIAVQLEIHIALTYSSGFIDYLQFSSHPSAHNTWMLIPLGLIFFGLYYWMFSRLILWLDIKTLGRADEDAVVNHQALNADPHSHRLLASQYLQAFGGQSNLLNIGACITRLRVTVVDPTRVDLKMLNSLGAKGVFTVGHNQFQVIIGPLADTIAGDMKLLAT